METKEEQSAKCKEELAKWTEEDMKKLGENIGTFIDNLSFYYCAVNEYGAVLIETIRHRQSEVVTALKDLRGLNTMEDIVHCGVSICRFKRENFKLPWEFDVVDGRKKGEHWFPPPM